MSLFERNEVKPGNAILDLARAHQLINFAKNRIVGIDSMNDSNEGSDESFRKEDRRILVLAENETSFVAPRSRKNGSIAVHFHVVRCGIGPNSLVFDA